MPRHRKINIDVVYTLRQKRQCPSSWLSTPSVECEPQNVELCTQVHGNTRERKWSNRVTCRATKSTDMWQLMSHVYLWPLGARSLSRTIIITHAEIKVITVKRDAAVYTILRISWRDHITNDELMRIAGMEHLVSWCSVVVLMCPKVFSERKLMFTFAICRRPSVCLSVCRLSVVCRL